MTLNTGSSTLLSPSVAVNARPIVLTYHVARPSGFLDRVDWPLLIILHGRGEREKAEKIKQNCLTDEILAVAANRLILVAPECPRDTAWPQMTHYLDAWLDQFVADPQNRVDAKSVYLTGYSIAVGNGGNGFFVDGTGFNATITAVPEPSSLGLGLVALAAVASQRRFAKRREHKKESPPAIDA